ncbi:MAG: translocation/assembly module TamB domain-containing protein [Candidatus Pedobacter colombiensis]|uniref:Translocation/assembly module TamB domain-containing protein n=1 Tax=Candidatus Pedobacter colombiensis TaxID=3121371 RepID=A0AAJ6B6N3_9SPHI|nr:translocation/assembly module TamB domain-containing protein [Pedobacter sp.]WEK18661.1 MAG: translocation/assembly module TamB domain-containing protein [Pedobacter sp.]
MQTYVAKKAAAYLSKELNTTVSLSSIYIKPFSSVVIEDLLVLDRQKDTILNTPKFLVNLNQFSLKQRIIAINTVQINKGSFFLKSYKDRSTNLDFIIDYFESGPPTVKKKKPFQLSLERVIFNNFSFKYKNYRRDTIMKEVNFDDVALSNLNGIFEGFNTKDHILQTHIKDLTFKEKSGFYLKNLTAFTTIDTNSIELKNLMLVTNRTRLTDYFQMSFKKFEDFNDYINKVKMKANFVDSHVSSRDVAYFASELDPMNLDIDIDGQITGLVNYLRAKKLTVKAGKATYIKGDFTLKGLPSLNETFMDMKVDMAGTNKADLEEIVTDVTGKKTKVIPQIIDKFGNINFNGSFTGFQNDFIAYGEFKTRLGRVVSDVNMKIDKKGIPSYTGNVKTYDFNLGGLINEKTLGRLTASLYVKGRGTEINSLSEKLNGDIDYIDFNDYRYRNVEIDGTFDKKFFDGSLKINDKNIQLVFDGGVNLNPKLPVFNFKANIKNARLRALKLYKDSLKIDAIFSTNFSGSNLDNIQGNLRLQQIKLDNVKGIYNVDSIELQASGIGKERSLTVKSDILDASIKGQYDLNTLPSYYKTLAKKYIPSLKADIVKFMDQIFQFNLNIKRFEPVAELLVPGLQIEDQAIFVGNFDSPNNTATLNGFIKKLKYKGVVVNNLIIDENTSTNQLQAIVTSDRVDLNDSLYIKNVNISNILRNDSLSLNVKLSNEDDVNQLDLNGLIEFANDTTARVSILPSILKVNNEEWKIQEKVNISFQDGKTEIQNFDLNNGKQYITLDGILSSNPKDLLLVGFKDFSLTTLNPFVKTLGLKISGNVNGETTLANILKSPEIHDNIKIDSLVFNDTYIGSLTDTSSYDKSRNVANIFTNIVAADRETLRAIGKLDLEKKEIDLGVKLDKTELAILSPFVKHLVSDLKGYVSADLTVNGSFEKPAIKGSLSLDKTAMTINYLKTRYTITDVVAVNNSVIELDGLKLLDVNGNKAIANGTVDLNDINNPGLDVNVNATNFMALNTTEKDNSLYFGQAYATGTFKFKGPTNLLYIDIDAKTEKGTVFNLPLNSSETVSSKDFITFVSKDTATYVKKQTSFEGLTMSLKLDVDANSTANIFTSLGNLSGKGNSKNLALKINSLGDFEMSGDYIIESGSFDFTAQEVINKKFSIRQGGTIRWTGNPNTAQINLKAIYSLRANTTDLYSAANREGTNTNERIPVEVEMGLTGLLLRPDIKLDVFFPSNPAIKEEMQSYFNDDNNRNLQALSLIIRRSFAPGTGKEDLGKQLTSGVTSTATELLFNQFNNVLSSLNLDFVDINIRSLSEANASFRFFENRIVLNAGIVDKRSTNSDLSPIGFNGNYVGGEVEVLALIKKDGTLVGKLANKPPTQLSIFNTIQSQNTNVTSLGLIYTQQFDSFKEFLQKITGKIRREEKKKKLEAQKKTAEDEKKPSAVQQPANKEAIINDQKKQKKK